MGDLRGRLIAFDLDGTLIDSSRDLADSVNDVLVERGAAPLAHDAITRMIGDGARVLVGRALTAVGLAEHPDDLSRFLAVYDTRLLNHTRLYEGVTDVVRTARAHARVAVLTNKPLRPTERVLDALGLRELFDDVIGGDGPFPRKPDPTALLALVQRAGATPSRSLMIGDSVIDYDTAQRASTRCCLVSYGFSSHSFAEVLTTGAWIAPDTRALAAAVERFVRDDGS